MSPIPDTAKMRAAMEYRWSQMFEERLHQALGVLVSGNTAIVIVPRQDLVYPAVTRLVQLMSTDSRYESLAPYWRAQRDAVFVEGTRGQVRVYSVDHVEYDKALKRFRGYSAGTPTFLHPAIEELS